jgi:hypothetical protein
MVSPMREKRTWPPQDKDSDGETVAAFEAAVAVVKETVVRSGEVLVSAKEDLSDHQRWLKAQTAAVEADRERHARWLERQRERQEALARREVKRTRRRQRRQALIASIKQTISSATFAVRSAVWRVAANIIGALNRIDALAGSGLSWLGRNLRDAALSTASAVRRGLAFVGNGTRAMTSALGRLFSAGTGRVGAKVHAVAPSVGQFLSVAFGGLAARGRDASRVIGRGLRAGLGWLSAKTGEAAHAAAERLGPAWSSVGEKAHTLAPWLAMRFTRAGLTAGHLARGGVERVRALMARGGVDRVHALMARAKPSRVEGQNALSLPRSIGRFDLSQMLIIAGALLLVCGGLMLGGGFLLRAGTPPQLEAASPAEPIAWLYAHKSLPIAERTLFIAEKTPDGFRVTGFTIGGVNMAETAIGALGGVIKSDAQGQEFDLGLTVEKPEGDQDEETAGAQAAAAAPEGTIPPQAPFKLTYLLPEAADGGLTAQEVLSSYGGLTLKVHYEMDGKRRTFIQYLPASLLDEQLAEIAVEAKGS